MGNILRREKRLRETFNKWLGSDSPNKTVFFTMFSHRDDNEFFFGFDDYDKLRVKVKDKHGCTVLKRNKHETKYGQIGKFFFRLKYYYYWPESKPERHIISFYFFRFFGKVLLIYWEREATLNIISFFPAMVNHSNGGGIGR